MNFTDMMKLEWKDTDQDKIYYTRFKTKGNFQIKYTYLKNMFDLEPSRNHMAFR